MWRGQAAAWSLAWHGGVLKVTAAWKETGACSVMQRRQPRGDVGMWPERLQKLDCYVCMLGEHGNEASQPVWTTRG